MKVIGLKFAAANINILIVFGCLLLFSFFAVSFKELYLWSSLRFILFQVACGLCGFYQVTLFLLAFLATAYCLTPEKNLPTACLMPAALSLVNITWAAYWWAWSMDDPSGCPGCWQQDVVAALFALSVCTGLLALVICRQRLPMAAALVSNSLWFGFISYFVAVMATTHQWI